MIQDHSITAWTAREEAEHAARMETPWMLLVSSGKPEGMAAALTWMGRHLGEMLWRFSVSMEVDALREQLGNADSETLFNRADSCRHRG